MKRSFAWIFAWALLLAPLAAAPGEANQSLRKTSFVLAHGTAFATPGVVLDSGVPGPVVFMTGGIHGNEPAGARAARQIMGWTPVRGKLIVIPRVNEAGLRMSSRWMPGFSKAERDLNRQFPRNARGKPVGVLANALWKRIRSFKATHVLDLHEASHFRSRNPKSVGNTVISSLHKDALAIADHAVQAINKEIDDDDKRFVIKRPPISGSMARAAADRLGLPSWILETTWRGQALSYRTRQQRILAHAILQKLGVIAHGPHVRFGHAVKPTDIRIGLYVSTGVGGPGPRRLEALLDGKRGCQIRRLCATDLQRGDIDEIDVMVFPGGSGSAQAKALGASGRATVRAYVQRGGGYLGICAGAYLAAANYSWSLRILDADVIDRAHWARGTGTVRLDVPLASPLRRTVPARDMPVLYANGPIYAAAGDPEIPDYEVLAVYKTEVRKAGVPGGVMPGTPAMVRGRFGKGHVVCASPHPEQTQGMDALVARLVHLAAGR